MKRLAGCAAVAVAALAVASAPAVAGKPGSGGGSTSGSASVTVSPNPAHTYSQVSITGCGYGSATAEVHVIHSSGYTQVLYVPMWSTGCMDNALFTTAEAGTYTIQVYQSSGGRHPTSVLKASTTLTVS